MKIEQAALSLYQLLGAPLFALIQAETYAANATADFIERVGFEPPVRRESDPASQADMGKLRTLSFKQERRTADGQGATYQVEVPLLSILPIPALQIKEAELEFFVKIVDMVTHDQPKRLYETVQPGEEEGKGPSLQAAQAGGEEEEPPAWSQRVPVLSPHLDMKAMLGRGQPSAARSPDSAFDMQVHVKIKVAQADTPAGLARLFNLMEQSVSSTKLE
jgi:hypothetical protein